ncbi:AIPR family protein [Bacillus thuringiensis]|uniref:AIPR family protein n=1 Tax=Bacillus thuringiensis TaxID=1428 RepID=UPI0035E0F343|nr:AIPR family protein [Bacillus cereus]
MSIIHVSQIKNHIRTLFEGKIDLSDVNGISGEHLENFTLTRSLTAYSIHFLAQVEPDIAGKCITDGSDDNGIDAIHYDERSKTLYLVQSKWIHDGNSEPSNGDVKKFLSGIRDLFNLRFEVFNSKINAMREKITNAILDANTNFEVILVYTGLKLSEHSQRDIDDFLKDVNDASEICSVTIFDQAKLHESLKSGITGDPINLQIGLKEWGMKAEPQKAFYGQVNGAQIAGWWHNHGKRLFAKNLRELIGDTEINKDIRKTIEEEPEHFWYYNNGITIVCNLIKKSVLGAGDNAFCFFECEDISIVNGAQTVGTIGKFGNNETSLEHLKNVFVPVRIISVEKDDEYFGKNITKNNNKQNKIENRDFVSLDPEQHRIQTELAIDGIKYFIMRSETTTRDEKTFDLVESTTALSCASGSVNLAVQLKREIGKLWENIEKAPYKQLFNPSVSGLYVWNCVKLQRLIDIELQTIGSDKDGRGYSIAVHGNRIISYLTFKDIDVSNFKNPGFNFETEIDPQHLSNIILKNYELLTQCVNDHYGNAVIPTLFKNLSKCQDLITKVLNIQATPAE